MERFWKKVKILGPDECWEWIASTHEDGYGWFGYNNKVQRAHRVSWQLHNGPIPDGLHVLHTCDNPSCVNPAHLWLGTNADNMKDRDSKNRTVMKIRKQYIVTFPNGREEIIDNLRKFCREHDLNQSNMVQLAKCNFRRGRQHKGFKCYFLDDNIRRQ